MSLSPHGQAKYPNSTLVMSSAQRHWSAITAELRSHRMSDGPGYSADQIEVAFLVKGWEGGTVGCKFGKERMPVKTLTGTVWVCPAGVQADEILIAASDLTSAHFYIPTARLNALAMDGGLRLPDKPSLRSAAVAEDSVIMPAGPDRAGGSGVRDLRRAPSRRIRDHDPDRMADPDLRRARSPRDG